MNEQVQPRFQRIDGGRFTRTVDNNFLRESTEEEATKETERARLELHHRIATLAVGLEQVAAHPEQLATFLEKLNNEPIPEAAKVRLRDIAQEFRYAVNGAEKNAHDLGWDTLDEVATGKELFYAMTGFYAGGVVTAKRREGYFTLTCNDQQDFGIATTEGMRTKGSTQEKAGGTFHSAVKILTHKRILSVIVMRPGQHWKSLLIHERQHWINARLFDGFEKTENGVPHEAPQGGDTAAYQEWLCASEHESAARHIKDEVIAYLRQGYEGIAITFMNDSKLYANLFGNDPEKWKNLLIDIDAAYKANLRSLFSDPDDCAILAAQLASIPLERMPEKMKDLGNYYRNRKKIAVGERNEDIVEAAGRVNSIVHPDVQALRQRLSEQVDVYDVAQKTAETAVIGSNGVFVADEALPHFRDAIFRAADDVMRTFAELEQKGGIRGAPYPSVDFIDSGNIDNEEVQHMWKESSLRIGEQILTIVEKIPLNKIDAAYDEIQNHDVDHRAEKLCAFLAEVLHAETGFTFSVDMTMYDDPHKFGVDIVQDPTDKLPKMRYGVSMYCSTTPAN